MQGTVFKITHNQIVVLCEDGRFRNLPLTTPAPKLGERITVELNELKQLKQSKQSKQSREQRKQLAVLSSKRWIAAIIIGLLVISTFTIVDQAFISRTAAMVAIDINPSVEMLVDRKGKVEKLLNVSEDATHLIGEQDIVNMNFYQAVNVLVANAESQGLLDASANETVVMMSIVNKGKDPFQVDLAKIEATEQYDIHIHYATNEDQELAEQAGLTLNKYYLYEQSKQKGLDLDIEDLRTKSVASLINESGLEMPSSSNHTKSIEQRTDQEKKAQHGKDKPPKDNSGKGKPDKGKPDNGKPDNGKPDKGKPDKPPKDNQGKGKGNGNEKNNGKGNTEKDEKGKGKPDKGDNNGKGNNGNGKGNSGKDKPPKDNPGKGKPEHADKNKAGKGHSEKGKPDKGNNK